MRAAPRTRPPTLAEREARRRRLWRRAAIATGALVIGFAGLAWLVTYTDSYARVPEQAWATGDVGTLADVLAATDPEGLRERQAAAQALLTPDSVPPAIVRLATDWQDEVNRHNPGLILLLSPDSYGNLHMVLDERVGTMPDSARVMMLDGLGSAWRVHLRGAVDWDPRSGFEPGIVAMLPDGTRVGYNLNGSIGLPRTTDPD